MEKAQAAWNISQEEQATADISVTVIVFSKDRAFQLSEYLRTLFKYCNGVTLKVVVLAHVQDSFRSNYQAVQDQFPAVNLLIEDDFCAQVTSLVRAAEDYIMFAVDDALFCAGVPLDNAVLSLAREPSLTCFHLRLSPGLTFCHPAGKQQRQPRLWWMRNGLLRFRAGEGTLDWDYPFELCGTLYRKHHVAALFAAIETDAGKKGLSHPNRLEKHGNMAWKQVFGQHNKREKADGGEGGQGTGAEGGRGGLPAEQQRAAEDQGEWRGCMPKRVMVVVTINRVQDLYANPVYPSCTTDAAASADGSSSAKGDCQEEEGREAGGSDGDVVRLQRLLETGRQLDEERYLVSCLHSIHVPGLYLAALADSPAPAHPLVSVLMPVHNGADFVSQAIQSVLNQSWEELELLVVDDGSTDDTPRLLRAFRARDRRVRVVSLSHCGGVANALREGVKMARGELLARMDADDVCDRERLLRQVLFLRWHPQCVAVGAAVHIFHGSDQVAAVQSASAAAVGDVGKEGDKVIVQATSGSLVRWHLLFFSPLAHPSVTFRASSLRAAGSYSSRDLPHVEDYALWLRLAGLAPPSPDARAPPAVPPEGAGYGLLCNMGDCLLHLRRHGRSISAQKREAQRQSTLATAAAAIAHLLPSAALDADTVQALQRAEEASSAAALNKAFALLSALHKLPIFRPHHEEEDERDAVQGAIKQDFEGRAGELSTLAITNFQGQPEAMMLWRTWLTTQAKQEGGGAGGLRALLGLAGR